MRALKIVPLKYIGFLKTANPHYKTFANVNGVGNSDMQETHLKSGNVFCGVQSNFGRVLKCPHRNTRHHARCAGGHSRSECRRYCSADTPTSGPPKSS